MFDNLKRKCDECGSLVTKVVSKEKSDVNLKHMIVGEPILLNPNSYNNVEIIIDQLKSNLNIPTYHEWTYVGCDGPRFCLASRICEADKEKYDWISLVPGLGHLNMNQLKYIKNRILK